MAAAKAQKAAESALMEKVKIYEELQRWKTKEFDASSSAKASTTAAAEAYESAGVLRKELNETKAELAGARSFVDAARAEVDAKTTALANQQAVNAGVMKMKNAMEWRVLEMQTALEIAAKLYLPLADLVGAGAMARFVPTAPPELLEMLDGVEVRKRSFLSHLYIKTIILPRQARDKHRENSKKDAVFGTGMIQLPGSAGQALHGRPYAFQVRY